MSKRRSKTTKSAMNSKLIVKHRELTEEEIYAQVREIIMSSFSMLHAPLRRLGESGDEARVCVSSTYSIVIVALHALS